MKKIKKGSAGYLDSQLKIEIIRTIIYFVLCIVIFILGYWQTGTKENIMTIVAVVGILPSSKALVGVIVRFPHRSISPKTAHDIASKSEHLTVIYDLIITSTEKVMPISCIAISGDKIFGYTDNQKVDLAHAGLSIKKMLQSHDFDVSVKIMNQYTPFLSRVEGLNNIQAIEKNDLKEQEEIMAQLIRQISM